MNTAARLAATALALLPAPAGAIDPAYWSALKTVDGRMAAIGYRLTTGNAALCRELQPEPGLQLHAIDQYRGDAEADARQVFGFARPVAVEAVVPGSPAALAGVEPNDALVAVNDTPVEAPGAGTAATSATRAAANALIAGQPADPPRTRTRARAGPPPPGPRPASPGCRSAFEVLLGPGLKAQSDGRIVQVSVRFFELYPDDKIAAIVAHELSHTILRHRARLEAAGVEWGLLSEFGRNGRLFRRTEDDADRLSVHLLRNAGYDPQAAVRFWREDGGRIDGGVFRGASHGSARERADALAREVATLPPPDQADTAPPVLATRDQPLS